MRKLTTIHNIQGVDRTGWATLATLLKRAQAHDKQHCGTHKWDDYPSNRWGWVTDTGRFLGVGSCAKSMLRKGESIVRVDLPFNGSGKTLLGIVRKSLINRGKITVLAA